MTPTRDLIKKMADFFTSEEYYEKGEDARLELSPDDVRCLNRLIQHMSNLDKIRTEIEQTEINGYIRDVECFSAGINVALNVIDKYRAESEG